MVFYSNYNIKTYISELSKEFQLENIKNKTAKYLSGGERRRVEIARALSIQPKFLLLDEPFAGIDPITILELQSIFKILKKWNLGVLITDHNVRETLNITDRSYILQQGEVLAMGSSQTLSKDYYVRKYYLGSTFFI